MTEERTPYEQAIIELSENREYSAVDLDNARAGMRNIELLCHSLAREAGWWDEYIEMPEQYRKHFIAGKMALSHSEVSESLEGFRKNLLDDHLPHRQMVEVEIADAIIRLFDLGGALGLDIARALIEKLAYNTQRPDHKPEARAAEGGKSL